MFLIELRARNEGLFHFGWVCLVAAVLFLILAKTTTTQVYGVNAWYKPLKFAFSTFTFAWHAEGRVSADQMSELRAAGDEISRMTWALIRYKLKQKG